MSFSSQPFMPVVTECPFLAQPCIQGDEQGFACQRRVKQASHVDPLARFRDYGVIYCAVCQKEISVSSVPRFESRPDQT